MIKKITADLLKSDKKVLYSCKLPKDIYAILINDYNSREHLIVIKHSGFCPIISDEREQSQYSEYLSNLEYSIANEYLKNENIESNKYRLLKELVTDSSGNIYHYLS